MKTHKSAVVITPPEEIWEPIQKIRRLYDRQFHRWMPHITLIYPFRPRSELERAFALRLRRLRYFTHGRDRFTMWLDPGPCESIAAPQAAFQAQVPDCDDVSKFPRGFTPHLSVCQAKGCRERSEPAVFRTNGSPSSSPSRTWPSSTATTTGRSAMNK